MERRFLTLGIESSCDDTALAIIDENYRVLGDLISSQIEEHSCYGGVVPELASRMHQEAILPLLEKLFEKAGITEPRKELSLIAVTSGPGLMGSLLVGVMTAKALAQCWNIPLLGVNHLEGHIFANIAEAAARGEKLEPPFISLIVSGGHTEVVLVKAFGDYQLLGSTRDDAAGEAYDKVSKILGLGYPGGPIIDRLAQQGNPEAFSLPTPLSGTDEVEFSFSGLKTAAITLIEKETASGESFPREDICASFQKAVTGSLLAKIKLAVKKTKVKQLTVSGGVAANSGLRLALEEYATQKGLRLFLPPRGLCTDNGVMIASAGYSSFLRGNRSELTLSPTPSWSLW